MTTGDLDAEYHLHPLWSTVYPLGDPEVHLTGSNGYSTVCLKFKSGNVMKYSSLDFNSSFYRKGKIRNERKIGSKCNTFIYNIQILS